VDKLNSNDLKLLVDRNRHWIERGSVADYIPELKNAKKEALGICAMDLEGNIYSAGDVKEPFTIQSISKVINLIALLEDCPIEQVLSKISFEPTADGFNDITSLETKNENKPLNPMINSGAIVVVSMLKGTCGDEKYQRALELFKKMSHNYDLTYNKAVYESEKATASRNRALAYYMMSTGVLEGDVEDILDAYFKLCSLEVNCEDLAKIGAVLANDGVSPITGEIITSKKIAKTVKAVMGTCGMYDASGDVAVSVGIPSKSGVGGGIMSSVPKKMGIGIFGPSLDKKGNSIAGLELLSEVSETFDLGIY
jgi:glutaminase